MSSLSRCRWFQHQFHPKFHPQKLRYNECFDLQVSIVSLSFAADVALTKCVKYLLHFT